MCIVLDDYLCATEKLDGQKESLDDAFSSSEKIFFTCLEKSNRKVLWQRSYCHDKEMITQILEV